MSFKSKCMYQKVLLVAILICNSIPFYAQRGESKFEFGLAYGFGNEFKNRNYTFTNEYFKVQLFYKVKATRNFSYEFLLQPELNFATHQLTNLYFIEPDDPDYLAKREQFTKLKNISEYVLNFGFLMRKRVLKSCSIYVFGSVGPMITDTETERLSKGFAFADILALGFTFKYNRVIFDVRPNIRHVSNAGLQNTNSGYNTKNIDFGFSFPL
jgi:hypothetical protein